MLLVGNILSPSDVAFLLPPTSRTASGRRGTCGTAGNIPAASNFGLRRGACDTTGPCPARGSQKPKPRVPVTPSFRERGGQRISGKE